VTLVTLKWTVSGKKTLCLVILSHDLNLALKVVLQLVSVAADSGEVAQPPKLGSLASRLNLSVFTQWLQCCIFQYLVVLVELKPGFL
jgi:hypothetical protein